jgi:hypothetical protein
MMSERYNDSKRSKRKYEKKKLEITLLSSITNDNIVVDENGVSVELLNLEQDILALTKFDPNLSKVEPPEDLDDHVLDNFYNGMLFENKLENKNYK